MGKKWRLRPADPDLQAKLAASLNLSPIVIQLLINRGITDPARITSFLNPLLKDLHDPFLLKDMNKAVARLQKAREAGETVLVYGDYDVDGVTSTAVVYRLLKKLGMKAMSYIPHRMDEGYGLNVEIVPLAKQWGVALLITVDCGVTAVEEVRALKEAGIDTIVIDHHEPEGDVPDLACAVIDPKQPQCTYPFKDLAGVGLAAKFVQAVTGEFPLDDLDLVTLGTIADVVPLKGENRIIARHGLSRIASSSKAGLQALIEAARVRGKEMTPHIVGFSLGPRLNAAGRMGSAGTSLELLLCDDPSNAAALVQALDVHNRDRQRMQSSVVDEAVDIIEGEGALAGDRIIVVHKEGWHKGVLGIAASKIAEKYGRPAIVISVEDGVGVGSARSVEGFHLNEALAHCAEMLEGFGGHKRAAGLRVKDHMIADLRARLNAFAETIFTDGVPDVALDIDVQLPLTSVGMALVETIASLEPFGEGNPAPLFATRRLMVKSKPQVMGKDTLKFWVTDGRETVSAVGFGMGADFGHLAMGQAVDIVYTLGIDDWNKAPQAQIMLKDLRIIK
ncbi:MAG: single-stranded-DNA-specific exonuclease RecJ [Candidatus Omnitrophica bacterium]|nr:single-stranded-DNA-specific exonuclease RecJ [Candidatus Omnitrophota bacterium]